MTRLIVPFPLLFLVLLGAAAINLVQWGVYEATANFLGKEVWVGECTPQKLQGSETVELLMLCDGEEVTTKDAAIILAWFDEQQSPQCSKEAYWNSGDVAWNCSASAEPAA
jgi:hypothetical protein